MLSLLLNIIAPTVIMMRFASEDKLGPVTALLVALAFPFVYGVYGMMTALSFPAITIPVFIVLTATILYIMKTVSTLTGLESEDVLRNPKKEVLKESPDEERVTQ
jgi:predicted membrane protein